MKKERPSLCKRCFQFGHPKKFCRNNWELYKDCIEPLQNGGVHNCGGDFCLYCKAPHKTGGKNICGEYIKEANIQNKKRHEKCDMYTAKETLGYQGEKLYVSVARGAAETEREKKRSKNTN